MAHILLRSESSRPCTVETAQRLCKHGVISCSPNLTRVSHIHKSPTHSIPVRCSSAADLQSLSRLPIDSFLPCRP